MAKGESWVCRGIWSYWVPQGLLLGDTVLLSLPRICENPDTHVLTQPNETAVLTNLIA